MKTDDRNDFSRDPDINAQRRPRRRGTAADEAAMAAYRRPVKPETDEEAMAAYRRPVKPENEEEKIDFRKPVQSETEEEKIDFRKTGAPEAEEPKIDFRKPIMPGAGEPEAETTNKEEPAEGKTSAGISSEDTRRIDLSETSAGRNAEPAGDSRQRADSRVPEEARRMAAAPYGTGRPEPRRPGTRPMAATPRPVGARPSPSARPEGVNGRGPARQTAVGYAPGRMNDGYTRQIRSQADLREEVAKAENEYRRNQEARAYLERRGQPFRDASKAEPAPRPASRGLKLLVVLLLIAGAVLTVLLVLKNRNSGDAMKNPNLVISFEETKPEGAAVCTDVTYSVLTSKDVKEIRLVDDDGEAVPINVVSAENADGQAWMITLNMVQDFEGVLRLEVRGEDEEWQPTERKSSKLAVRGVPISTPESGNGQTEVTLPPEAQELITPTPEATAAPEVTEAPEETKASEETAAPEETEAPEGSEEAEERPEDKDGEAENEAEEPDEEEPAEPETPENGEDSGSEEEAFREVGELRTVVPTATPEPEEIEKPTETPPLTAEAAPEANPDLITNTTVYVGSKKQKDYNRPQKELIHMPEADKYTLGKMGVLTFRGDNFRRNAAVGPLEGEATGLAMKWQVESGSSRGTNQTYYGYGWPGQPAIVKWSKQVRPASNLYESKQEKELLKEVIIAGQDGNIRFLDLDDGSLTRNSIKLGYPMNGTPSLHTVGQPYMSVGQFARKMKVKTGRIGLRTYNLYNTKELKMIDGLDSKHRRALNNIGSFETSALIDRTSDTLITAGSNGMLYLEALNSEFDWKVGVMKVNPSETAMTSRAKGQKNNALTAVESSLAAYDKYVFYADMGGVLRCVDTDTLRPVWAVATGDAVMAAVALDLTEARELNLYTANMYANRKKGSGEIQIRRYDALSGREAWCTEIGVYKGKKDKEDVGAKASPVIGQGKLKDLVYFTVTGLSEEGREQLGLSGEEASALIALDKNTGKTVWAKGMESRTESSPVAVYDGDGNGWIIQCAEDGNIYLVEGLTGKETGSMKLEAEIIASPAVYNDTMVIGTTGKGTSFIYGIEIRTTKAAEDPQNTEAEETPEAEEAEPEIKEEPAEEAEPADEAGEAEDDGEEWDEEEGEGANE